MRYLLLADIHANLEALDAVLAAASREGYDRVAVLGDLVGYGADPNGVVERVRALAPDVIVRGNHDRVAAGLEPPHGFSPTAYLSIVWTAQALTPHNRGWLASLPHGPLTITGEIGVCHGSPTDEDEYLADPADVGMVLGSSPLRTWLCGHTHLQVAYALAGGELSMQTVGGQASLAVDLVADAAYLVNPGAVGQPRDGDPRAAFAVLDTSARRAILHRVDYARDRAQARILEVGLPAGLATRLGAGR